MNYYFVWEHLPLNNGKKKTGDKYVIQPKESPVTWICDLYLTGDNLPKFVILTRDADEDIRFIYDRLPLMVPKDLIDEWIELDNDPGLIAQ